MQKTDLERNSILSVNKAEEAKERMKKRKCERENKEIDLGLEFNNYLDFRGN
jgi:hypothetical protein